MTNPFYRLAPFIQEYIYREKWGELRPVQVKAIGTILDTPNHVLITSRTASGKTEAAFLPILTRLYEDPPASIGVVYIGPLKALINDQFYRLQGLLEDSGIPVQSWHGDVPQSRKTKFLRQAQGVLQITPESLEAMLIRRQTELGRLFGDLRFVVIDEAFGRGSDDSTRYALKLFTRLGLQLLIVTPLQKIHVIEPHVECLGFVDNLNDSYSRLQRVTIQQLRASRQTNGDSPAGRVH